MCFYTNSYHRELTRSLSLLLIHILSTTILSEQTTTTVLQFLILNSVHVSDAYSKTETTSV